MTRVAPLLLSLAACARSADLTPLAGAEVVTVHGEDARWRPGPEGGVLVIPLRVENRAGAVARVEGVELALQTPSGPVCRVDAPTPVRLRAGAGQRLVVEAPCPLASLPPEQEVALLGAVRLALGDEAREVSLAGEVPLAMRSSAWATLGTGD